MASLVLGVVSLIFSACCFVGSLLGLVAVVLGVVALNRVGSEASGQGKSLAIGGIITGGLGFIIYPALMLLGFGMSFLSGSFGP